jgi:hypothetical protein
MNADTQILCNACGALLGYTGTKDPTFTSFCSKCCADSLISLNPTRDEALVERFLAGEGYPGHLAKLFHMTRQNVQQILARRGLEQKDVDRGTTSKLTPSAGSAKGGSAK